MKQAVPKYLQRIETLRKQDHEEGFKSIDDFALEIFERAVRKIDDNKTISFEDILAKATGMQTIYLNY